MFKKSDNSQGDMKEIPMIEIPHSWYKKYRVGRRQKSSREIAKAEITKGLVCKVGENPIQICILSRVTDFSTEHDLKR